MDRSLHRLLIIFASLVAFFVIGSALLFVAALFSGAGHGPTWVWTAGLVGYWMSRVSGGLLLLFLLGFASWVLFSRTTRVWQKGLAIGIPLLAAALAFRPLVDRMAYDAAIRGNVKNYQLARKLGARVVINDHLWLAARWGHLELVEHLISQGADPNGRLADKGDRILWAAMDNLSGRPDGGYAVVKYLLDHGANPGALDRDNETIIDMAKRSARDPRIIQLLESYPKTLEVPPPPPTPKIVPATPANVLK